MSKFINPLDSISDDQGKEDSLKSTSSLMMDDAKICPKCKTPMDNATLSGGAPALWCVKGCRVSSPVPIEG